METKVIATSKAPAAIGPYVQGIQAGNIIFFSGQLGIDPAVGKLVEGCVAVHQLPLNARVEIEATVVKEF